MSTPFNPSPNSSPSRESNTRACSKASDIVPRLTRLRALIDRFENGSSLEAPVEIHESVDQTIAYLNSCFASSTFDSTRIQHSFGSSNTSDSSNIYDTPSPLSGNSLGFFVQPRAPYVFHHPEDLIPHSSNVKINRLTTLERLYLYRISNTIVEYPATSATGSVGHKFAMDPQNWVLPGFAYSRGKPSTNPSVKHQKVDVLCDGNGSQVPCYVGHKTCKRNWKSASAVYEVNLARTKVKE